MRYREIEPEDIAFCARCQQWHGVSKMADASCCKACDQAYWDDINAINFLDADDFWKGVISMTPAG